MADVVKQVGAFTKAVAESSSPESIARASADAADADAKARQKREREELLARLRPLAAELGPRYSPTRATLDSYKIQHPAQRAAVERIRRIAAELDAFIAEG